MKKLTKANIEQLANEIMQFLDKHEMQDAVCIYFNNKRIRSKSNWDGENLTYQWIEESNIDPHNYFEYAAYGHILSMSFEGSLYDCLNYSFGRREEQFRKLFDKYNLYFELGNFWNLTAYPINDDMEIEYTYYEKPQPIIDLYYHARKLYPKELQPIMETWYKLSLNEGDKGSCVLGAGIEFDLDGQHYFMHACSRWQGSLSWEPHVETIKSLLKEIGATNIYYNCGYMD